MFSTHTITMQHKNTYESGTLNFFLYPSDEGTFVAACNELCIVKEGKDAELVKLQTLAAAKSYLLNVIKHKLGEHLLNQNLPKEILDEFNEYRTKKRNEAFQKWEEDIKKFLKKDCITA
ncbi:MAG: hypothetical protein Q8L01_02820 [Candidatus Woesebacteria bacterium]|nr:hypothetical protein [Candidatus Woesebacteria bacterium]